MTQEELNDLKEEIKALNKKLNELTEDELAQVSGGVLLVGGQYVLLPADGLAGIHMK